MNTTVEPASLTVSEIVQRVSQVKPISEASFWRLKVELGLSPVGVRQRPARYPASAVAMILKHYGVTTGLLPVAGRRVNLATGAELREIKRRVKR